MSSAQVGAVLRHIRQLATARHDHEVPDRQLLERFAARRDEAAFAALLKRHGPMVLGVCKSVLRNLHDAEDAFQAAFLLLAQKAGSIHRREAVSGWLYRVAYHLAVRTQANAARRRVHEKRAVTMPSADPVLDMSLREVRAALFEELEGLPEQYRAPLVLCALEEKSLEEAARLLGSSRGAVKGLLERGRELLRNRLRRRGLELPAGLLATALALNSASAQVPAALAGSTLRAAIKSAAAGGAIGGVISAEVAALVEGASKSMFCNKAKIATALVLAVSVVAAACGVVRHRATAAEPPATEQSPAEKPKDRPKPEAEKTVEVRGRVLDPDGKPVEGAKLYLARATADGPATSPQGTSGSDGRFRFTIPRSEPAKGAAERSPALVMAVAKGHGCDWVRVGAAEEVTLRLVKDVPIGGRILDPDGKPLAGAKLTVMGVSAAQGNGLGYFLYSISLGRDVLGPDYLHAAFARGWVGPLPDQPAVLTTGADGRFKLAGAGRDRVVGFRLEGPAIASADLAVRARLGEKVGNVYGAVFDYLAVASRPIRGVVRDKDTNKPLAGATVGVLYNRWCQVVTDKEGRYELLGAPKVAEYRLAVKPADALHFERWATIKDTAGLDALTADIDMVSGLTVRGKVTDKATGKPVARARVEYYPLWVNPHVTKLPGMWSPHSEATTGADGSYALTVLPGPGFLGVTGPKPDTHLPAWVTLKERKAFFKTPLALDFADEVVAISMGSAAGPLVLEPFNAVVLLEPGEKETGLVKDVALEPALTLKGRVVDPDGKPLSGVRVSGLLGNRDETLAEAEFTLRRSNPRANRPLVFYHKDKALGFFLQEPRGDQREPLTIKLQPCGSATGRIVDADGKPIADLPLELYQTPAVDGRVAALLPNRMVEATRTDRDGRFRANGLVPGVRYYLRGAAFSVFEVESGKVKELGQAKAE